MKRLALALSLIVAIVSASGCKKPASDNDGIRAGIVQHLAGVGTLNMNSMDMDIRTVSINGNQAHAEVEFRPKNGGTPGTGMQVGYNLEKREGAWVVMKSQPMGGMIQHPDPTQNPHRNQDVHSGLPNFNEILNPSGSPAQSALPPVNSQQASSLASGQEQSSQKKP